MNSWASCCLKPPHRGAFGAAVSAIAACTALGLKACTDRPPSAALHGQRGVEVGVGSSRDKQPISHSGSFRAETIQDNRKETC